MKSMQKTLYELIAQLLEYPTTDFPQHATGIRQTAAADRRNEASEESEIKERILGLLNDFHTGTVGLSETDLEELYTRTFDINPVCSLDISWHLYGENYERGAFLVRMRDLLRHHKIPESTELPDHLTSILRLLAVLESSEADRLVSEAVLPALRKMLEGFSDHSNPYEPLLLATEIILTHNHLRLVGEHPHG